MCFNPFFTFSCQLCGVNTVLQKYNMIKDWSDYSEELEKDLMIHTFIYIAAIYIVLLKE